MGRQMCLKFDNALFCLFLMIQNSMNYTMGTHHTIISWGVRGNSNEALICFSWQTNHPKGKGGILFHKFDPVKHQHQDKYFDLVDKELASSGMVGN